MAFDTNRPRTAADIARAIGAREYDVSRRLDKKGIDLTSVRATADGRAVAKTHDGTNMILYGVDSGPNGRTHYWGSWGAVNRLRTQTEDYPELEGYGARLYFPRFEAEE